MERALRGILVLLVIGPLLVLGCRMPGGHSPPARYWVLDSVTGVPAETEIRVQVAVGRFELPVYLKRAQYVERVGERQLRISSRDRWGEPLDRAISEVVARNLRIQAPGVEARATEFERRTVDYRLTGVFASFEVVGGKTAQLDAVWKLERLEDGEIVARGQGVYQESLTEPGVDAGVAALSRALASLSAEIASALGELE